MGEALITRRGGSGGGLPLKVALNDVVIGGSGGNVSIRITIDVSSLPDGVYLYNGVWEYNNTSGTHIGAVQIPFTVSSHALGYEEAEYFSAIVSRVSATWGNELINCSLNYSNSGDVAYLEIYGGSTVITNHQDVEVMESTVYQLGL